MLFIHLGALVELYCGIWGGGLLGAGGLYEGLNACIGPNLLGGAVVHLRAFTSCLAFTTLMALFFKS